MQNALVLLALLATAAPAKPTSIQEPRRTVQTKSATLNEFFEVGGTRYRITKVEQGLKGYKQRYDQRGETFRPLWPKDQLVVVTFEITAPDSQQRYIESPTVMPNLIDDQGVFHSGPASDIQQGSRVVTAGQSTESLKAVYQPAMIAPGGRAQFALVFSLPENRRAVEFYAPLAQRVSGIASTDTILRVKLEP